MDVENAVLVMVADMVEKTWTSAQQRVQYTMNNTERQERECILTSKVVGERTRTNCEVKGLSRCSVKTRDGFS